MGRGSRIATPGTAAPLPLLARRSPPPRALFPGLGAPLQTLQSGGSVGAARLRSCPNPRVAAATAAAAAVLFVLGSCSLCFGQLFSLFWEWLYGDTAGELRGCAALIAPRHTPRAVDSTLLQHKKRSETVLLGLTLGRETSLWRTALCYDVCRINLAVLPSARKQAF